MNANIKLNDKRKAISVFVVGFLFLQDLKTASKMWKYFKHNFPFLLGVVFASNIKVLTECSDISGFPFTP